MIKKLLLLTSVFASVFGGEIALSQTATREEVNQAMAIGQVIAQWECTIMSQFGIYESNELYDALEEYGGSTYQEAWGKVVKWLSTGRRDLAEVTAESSVRYSRQNCPDEFNRWRAINDRR